jgi:hypothetical protein
MSGEERDRGNWAEACAYIVLWLVLGAGCVASHYHDASVEIACVEKTGNKSCKQ